jgi:hypothetical protein
VGRCRGGRFAAFLGAFRARLRAEIVGSALALQNSLGFAITMVSIQLGTAWVGERGMHIAWLLLPGPVLGLLGEFPLWRLPARGHRSPPGTARS